MYFFENEFSNPPPSPFLKGGWRDYSIFVKSFVSKKIIRVGVIFISLFV
jgi:hypothetical protein